MPIREFICEDCELNFEKLVLGKDESNISCKGCGSKNIHRKLSKFYAKLSDSNTTLDNRVGRMSEKRWEQVYEEKKVKEKVRETSSTKSLTKVYSKGSEGDVRFLPTSEKEIKNRQEIKPIVNKVQQEGKKVRDSNKKGFVDSYILKN